MSLNLQTRRKTLTTGTNTHAHTHTPYNHTGGGGRSAWDDSGGQYVHHCLWWCTWHQDTGCVPWQQALAFWESQSEWKQFEWNSCWNVSNLSHLSMLKGVTISGKVRFCAIERGTPTWSILKLGSGVITARAEKSTRLPIRLPWIWPSLVFNLCLSGLPLRWTACVWGHVTVKWDHVTVKWDHATVKWEHLINNASMQILLSEIASFEIFFHFKILFFN